MKCVAFRVKDAHHKNKIAFKQMCRDMNIDYKECDRLEDIPQDTDFIWSDNTTIFPQQVPEKTKLAFGPGFFVFPDPRHTLFYFDYNGKGFLNCLSPWVVDLYNEFINGPRIPFLACPFPVDTVKFAPNDSKKEIDVLVYFKYRDRKIYDFIPQLFEEAGLTYKVIIYGKYKEEEFIDYLNKSKLVLWIGCHESQGFAFQEVLSMNVPILCYDVKTMFEEYGFNGHESFCHQDHFNKKNLKATSATYWDKRCGEKTNEFFDIPNILSKMLNSLDSYKPREFILENLSSAACWKKWVNALGLKKSQ